jgi:signal transduction histidine kinase
VTTEGALAEKVRRLERDVEDLEQRVEAAHRRAEAAGGAAETAIAEVGRVNVNLQHTTRIAQGVDAALKTRMQEEEVQRRSQSAIWRMVQIAASLGLFAWSLFTGKLSTTLEYLRQLAAGPK